MPRVSLILVSCFLACGQALASAVVVAIGASQEIVHISHGAERAWRPSDTACVDYGEEEEKLTCGQVILSCPKGALVRFTSKQTKISEGDTVFLKNPTLNPSLSEITSVRSLRDEAEKQHWGEMIAFYQKLLGWGGSVSPGGENSSSDSFTPESGESHFSKNYNVGVGINSLYPVANLQASIAEHWAMGVIGGLGNFSVQGASGSLLGAVGTVSYYSLGAFHGWWLQAGAGYYSSNTTYQGFTGTQTGLSALATVGWRSLWKNINAGVGVGGQFYLFSPSDQQSITVTALAPTVLVDLSWSF